MKPIWFWTLFVDAEQRLQSDAKPRFRSTAVFSRDLTQSPVCAHLFTLESSESSLMSL